MAFFVFYKLHEWLCNFSYLKYLSCHLLLQYSFNMLLRKLHYYSAIIITAFIVLHLVNHAASLISIDTHIELMNQLRKVYRHPFAECLLILAVLFQIFSGIRLFLVQRKIAKGFFERLQIWSGVYLAFFFLIHLSAVFAGRYLLKLDTNFYFGVAGLNQFPLNLFFIPYYSLAVFSFFSHIASIHYQKMKKRNVDATIPSKLIIVFGVIIVFLLIYGLTNTFKGVTVPDEYGILIGK